MGVGVIEVGSRQGLMGSRQDPDKGFQEPLRSVPVLVALVTMGCPAIPGWNLLLGLWGEQELMENQVPNPELQWDLY